jgi:hypothetical protein
MDKGLFALGLIFFYFTAQLLIAKLIDLSVITVDKYLGLVPSLLKGFFELTFVMLKTVVRISIRLWRYYTAGVYREARQEVGPSGIHITVNPVRTDNTLGHSPTQNLTGSGHHVPVIIEHQPIRR